MVIREPKLRLPTYANLKRASPVVAGAGAGAGAGAAPERRRGGIALALAID